MKRHSLPVLLLALSLLLLDHLTAMESPITKMIEKKRQREKTVPALELLTLEEQNKDEYKRKKLKRQQEEAKIQEEITDYLDNKLITDLELEKKLSLDDTQLLSTLMEKNLTLNDETDNKTLLEKLYEPYSKGKIEVLYIYSCRNGGNEVLIDFIDYLVEHQTSLDVRDGAHQTTLLHLGVTLNNTQLLEKLLQHGANPNIEGSRYWNYSPLHLATRFEHLECMRLLILYGADVNAPGTWTSKNQTPLHFAVNFYTKLTCVQLLLDHKADPTLQDSQGNTAAMDARYYAKFTVDKEGRNNLLKIAELLESKVMLKEITIIECNNIF